MLHIRRRPSLLCACLLAISSLSCGNADEAPDRGGHAAGPESTGSRLLLDQDGVGVGPAITAIDDAGEFEAWWIEARLEGEPPTVDFDRETVLAFTATYGSGCQYGFQELRIERPERTVEARYSGSEPAEACAADVNPFTVVVAVDRTGLDPGRWTAVMSVSRLEATFEVG